MDLPFFLPGYQLISPRWIFLLAGLGEVDQACAGAANVEFFSLSYCRYHLLSFPYYLPSLDTPTLAACRRLLYLSIL
jgi:hypothetical protein